MKVALFLLFVGVATASPVAFEEELLTNSIDELVKKAFEYVRGLLRKHEPYPFPDIPELTLVDDDVNIKFSTKNVLISKASDFTVDKVSNNIPKLHASFQVSIPTAHIAGDFQVTGTAFQKAVKGSGKFSVDIQNLVQRGDIQLTFVDHSLQIKKLTLDYDIKGASFDVQGLNVEGFTDQQLKDFLNKELVKSVEQKKAFFCEKAANHITEITNKLLKGYSLSEVIDFLRQIVASTPDPPPFPTFAP